MKYCLMLVLYRNKHSCLQDIDDCGSSPCMNDATCVDGLESYSCRCVPGYSGSNCQIGKRFESINIKTPPPSTTTKPLCYCLVAQIEEQN